MPKILVVQGANMNRLGERQPEVNGHTTAAELDELIRRHAKSRGLVMNPAGLTWAGYALADTIRSTRIPYVEVHVSNLYARYDRPSVVAPAAQCVVMGLGVHGYILGLDAALHPIAGAA